MSHECRIRCRVAPGAFDDEKIVTVPVVDSSGVDTEISCLAYGDSVELPEQAEATGDTTGILRAYCLAEQDDMVAVVLPQSTLQNGPNVIVRRKHLVGE